MLMASSITFGQDEYFTGLILDDDAYEQTPMKARNVSFQDVVSEQASASLKHFVPDIRNQGGYGTCVGWASAYYGRTILNARRKNLVKRTVITENTYAPIFTYLSSNKDDDYNCQGGAFIGKAMEAMVEKGVPFYNSFPELCATSIPEEIEKEAASNRIKDFTRLFGSDESNAIKIESVKRSLVSGNPAIIGFMVEKSFYSAKTLYEPDDLGITGGHAMCVIGYDDDKYGGSFEIVNSWGKSWGNDGFMWVRYEDFAEYTRYAFEMIPRKDEPKALNVLAGELELQLRDRSIMEVEKGDGDYTSSVLGWQNVVVEDDSQSIGDYITTETYPINTRYRMYAKVNKPSYVYVIGVDSKNPSALLFPQNDSISPYINSENAAVVLPPPPRPNTTAYFALNQDVESDYSVVIFSLEKIDLNSVKKQLDEMEGELLDKLYIIFNDKLIEKDKVELQEGKMGFRAEFEKGSMAMMILDIRRS